MYLKSLTLAGFKSFPERTTLDFGPGVSVIVGPNGSGKSNVTDAVLWVMGEQSPTAVRGHAMQDVIFGGGNGVQPRGAAEVEIVLDNGDGEIELPLSEISIVRRLDRNGEGSYRLNGVRCRLADVRELLADTGLGRESHSVISQGRVGEVVLSRPRERRMLIEEAAGLGKHRARRRRAQLKLERTAANLDRALDIEREARSRLKPLRRQSQAAELHERLELQSLQARLELARDEQRIRAGEVAGAQREADEARAQRDAADAALAEVAGRRSSAEQKLALRAERLEELSGRTVRVRGALERISLRREQTKGVAGLIAARAAELERELELAPAAEEGDPTAEDPRVAQLEAELQAIDAARGAEVEHEVADLRGEEERLRSDVASLSSRLAEARAGVEAADEAAEAARERLAQAEADATRTRTVATRVRAEHAAVSQFVAERARVTSRSGRHSLADRLTVEAGLESALAAALGTRLDALIAADVRDAGALLDDSGADGGAALVANARPAAAAQEPPAGARALAELVDGAADAVELARHLLAGVWLVARIEDLPPDFAGVAVTRGGRRWDGGAGELRQIASGGSEVLLARRAERDRLAASLDEADAAERAARQEHESAEHALGAAQAARTESVAVEREAARQLADSVDALERVERALERRRTAPLEGPAALRRAQVEGELAAERRRAQERALEQAQARERRAWAQRRHDLDGQLAPRAQALLAALEDLAAGAQASLAATDAAAAEDREAGAGVAAELAACGAREAELQSELRASGERVTSAEVQAQRARDLLAETEQEIAAVRERMGVDAAGDAGDAGDREPLSEEAREELRSRIERLRRRREQLGPVNPLAKQEYADAVSHVEELETRRSDLEDALRELRGVIRETDRQIERRFTETFAAAAENFERMAGELFPGGSGRLRLVEDAQPVSPRVLGGEPGAGDEPAEEIDEQDGEVDLRGVEIEIVPAGKSARRLSLLSGGEKSMTALAFLFAVFLARPCPFYILDEVEAALDDLNLDRFIDLIRRHADRAQFIVITHQRRTMEAADALYGVSMAQDGVSKVVSRRLPHDRQARLVAASAA